MPSSLETPIIIGVGDIKNRSTALSDAREPLSLIHDAVLAAIHDASPSDAAQLQSAIDSIDVVRTWTWPYPDLPGALAQKLGVKAGLRHKHYSEHGGDKPGKLLDMAARRVATGQARVAVVAGGEALASLTACAAAGKMPPPGWTESEEEVDSVFTPTDRDYGTDLGGIHGLAAPIHIYPLYENGFRAHRGQSIKDNHEESTKLYAEFSKIAEKQPYAWNYGTHNDESVIGTVSKKNRMIAFPYPLLMNAFNAVNLAAACLVTTTSTARALHIPESKWIYPLGGAGTADSESFWHRPNFHTSPSISRSLDAALAVTNLSTADIDLFDFYSCFPIVPKLAAHHLGLPIIGGDKKLSLLGGLTSFGGAGNNYSMHALTELTRQLRAGKGKNGLVLCNGGWLSYQYAIVLSREPRTSGGYPEKNPLSDHTDAPAPAIEERPEGEAVVETYTVAYERDGSPYKALIIGRLKRSGKRFLANDGDEQTLRVMAGGSVEIVGRTGWVWLDKDEEGRGLFSFERGAKM